MADYEGGQQFYSEQQVKETGILKNVSGNEAGKQFFSALQTKAMDAVSSIIHSDIYTIQYPSQGDFVWRFLNDNGFLNVKTFNYISARVSPGDTAQSAVLSDAGGFVNAYAATIEKISYTLSSANRARMNEAQRGAQLQANTIITNYQNIYGPITDAQMAEAGQKGVAVSTKVDYVISYILGCVWSGTGVAAPLTYVKMQQADNLRDLLPKMPASGDQVVTDVSSYLDLMEPVLAIQDMSQHGASTIKKLKNNTRSPSETNGGMKTFDPVDGSVSGKYQVGYGLGNVQKIYNDLQNKGNSISLKMSVSQSAGSSISVHIEGQSGFEVGNFLTFSVQGGASYDMTKVTGASTRCDVSITWAGYSVVPVSPAAWKEAQNTGWYYPDVIAQAAKNGDNDVDGFKFVSPPDYNLADFKKGGTFNLLTNLLIANYPTITINYHNADFNSFKQSWNEHVSGNVTLFGFIKLGSFGQGAYGSSYTQGASNSEFSVSFSASREIIGLPQYQEVAYVIGGAVNSPAHPLTQILH